MSPRKLAVAVLAAAMVGVALPAYAQAPAKMPRVAVLCATRWEGPSHAVGVADPVLIGLVPSLPRPGGNLTGLATLPARGFIAKQLELLKELLPHASPIAVFSSRGASQRKCVSSRRRSSCSR